MRPEEILCDASDSWIGRYECKKSMHPPHPYPGFVLRIHSGPLQGQFLRTAAAKKASRFRFQVILQRARKNGSTTSDLTPNHHACSESHCGPSMGNLSSSARANPGDPKPTHFAQWNISLEKPKSKVCDRHHCLFCSPKYQGALAQPLLCPLKESHAVPGQHLHTWELHGKKMGKIREAGSSETMPI